MFKFEIFGLQILSFEYVARCPIFIDLRRHTVDKMKIIGNPFICWEDDNFPIFHFFYIQTNKVLQTKLSNITWTTKCWISKCLNSSYSQHSLLLSSWMALFPGRPWDSAEVWLAKMFPVIHQTFSELSVGDTWVWHLRLWPHLTLCWYDQTSFGVITTTVFQSLYSFNKNTFFLDYVWGFCFSLPLLLWLHARRKQA